MVWAKCSLFGVGPSGSHSIKDPASRAVSLSLEAWRATCPEVRMQLILKYLGPKGV